MNEIKNLINNQNFLMEEPTKEDPLTPCMDYHKEKIQSNGSLYRLKLIIVVKSDLKNKYVIGDTSWSPTSSMKTLNFLLTGTSQHKVRVYQLYSILGYIHQTQNHNQFGLKWQFVF